MASDEKRWYLMLVIDGYGDLEVYNLGNHETDEEALERGVEILGTYQHVYTPIGIFVIERGFEHRYVEEVWLSYPGRRWELGDELANVKRIDWHPPR